MEVQQLKRKRLEAAILLNRPSGITEIHCEREYHNNEFLRTVIDDLVKILFVKSVLNEPPSPLEIFALLILDNHIQYQTDGSTLADVIDGKADEKLKEYHGLVLEEE